MKLSIIIPIFNGVGKMEKCLDSIYSQNIPYQEFEVICVNDCSPDPAVIGALNKYKEKIEKSQIGGGNLQIINHLENKRQGGARNTGIKAAKGEYIQFIDQDDYFLPNSLDVLFKILRVNSYVDVFIYEDKHTLKELSENLEKNNYVLKSQSGPSFVAAGAFSWAPWFLCIKRNLLLSNNIEFVEKVRFEDADFVIRTLMASLKVSLIHHLIIIHTTHDQQTSYIQDDALKIKDSAKLFYRVRLLAELSQNEYPRCSVSIMHHHHFAYNDFCKKLFWRLSPKDFLNLINDYPPSTPSPYTLLNFVVKYPKIYIYTSSLLNPILKSLRNIYVKVRNHRSK